MNEQKIEGLPLGTKIVAYRKPNPMEHVLHPKHKEPQLWFGGEDKCGDIFPIVVADNVYGRIDLSLVPIPEGWERLPDDWYRIPRLGDQFLSQDGAWVYTRISSEPSLSPRIILRKKAPSNAYGKDIDSIAIPEGWEKVGLREPMCGDDYIGVTGDILTMMYPLYAQDCRRIIVKRKKKRYIVAKHELRDGATITVSSVSVPTYHERSLYSVNVASCHGSTSISLSIIEE